MCSCLAGYRVGGEGAGLCFGGVRGVDGVRGVGDVNGVGGVRGVSDVHDVGAGRFILFVSIHKIHVLRILGQVSKIYICVHM